MSEQLNELNWKPTPEQEKWLGKANRQDPYILWRMPGKKPPISYFTDPSDQELAKAIGYVEKPAPVTDLNPPETATTAAAPDNKNKSEPIPLDKPAVTRAAIDTRNRSEMTPLDSEPTASDIDPDADGEDMNFNPDMSTIPAPKAEPGELKPADRVLDPEDEAELAKKYDADIAAMKQAANPQASADAQRGANAEKLRSTLDMLGGATQAQKDAMAANTWDPSRADGGRIDPDASGEDMNANPSKTPSAAELQQAMMQDNGLDLDYDAQATADDDYQDMGPKSFKDVYKKLDLDKPMPNTIGNDEDLYKALNGNLDWLNKNIK